MSMEAIFSPCGRFRYILKGVWDQTKPLLIWCLLNPSVAGQLRDDGSMQSDPTWRKGRGFSERHGYGGQVFCNPWAFCATDFDDLKRAGYPVGPDNDKHILDACAMGDGSVVCAWGANAKGLSRPVEVLSMIRAAGYRTMALTTIKHGLPGHPLMLPYKLTLQPYPASVEAREQSSDRDTP